MSIIAKFGGRCDICNERWEPGERIGRWLGKHAHFSCRQALISERSVTKQVTELPEARGWADKPQRSHRRQTYRALHIGSVKQQDGRSSDGRYQSKPDPE